MNEVVTAAVELFQAWSIPFWRDWSLLKIFYIFFVILLFSIILEAIFSRAGN